MDNLIIDNAFASLDAMSYEEYQEFMIIIMNGLKIPGCVDCGYE